MRTVWGLLVGLLLLFAVGVQGRDESFAASYGCQEEGYNPEEYRTNLVGNDLLRAISLIAPSSSFSKKAMRNSPAQYVEDLRGLYRDGIGRWETHTYILWGEIMIGLSMVWFLLVIFFYLPLMCCKWLRRKCCPFAWKRPRTEFGCGLWTLMVLAPIGLFLVAVAILYSVWFLEDFNESKCLAAQGADALYFGHDNFIGFAELATQLGNNLFADGVNTVAENVDRIINHIDGHHTAYQALAIALLASSAISVLGVVFAIMVFYHYWSREEYINPIRPPGGFHTHFAGFLTFGYGFWGSILLAASGVAFAFLYFPSDFCRFAQVELLNNGRWTDYDGIDRYINIQVDNFDLPSCLRGEDAVAPASQALDLNSNIEASDNSRILLSNGRADLESLLSSCGTGVCYHSYCRDDPNFIQAGTLYSLWLFAQANPPLESISEVQNIPLEISDLLSCVSEDVVPDLLNSIERVVVPFVEGVGCSDMHTLMDQTIKLPCAMLMGDLGALAWIYFGLAILNFVCWIFITRFFKARRRLMDGLKGDQSKEPEPIQVMGAAGGSNRITEDAFLLAAEQNDIEKIIEGVNTYPPNSVYDLLYNNSPLHLAAYYGHEEIVRTLLKEGYDPNDLNFHDYTPFSAAASNTLLDFQKKKRILELLHASGADLDTFDHQGDTPLISATRNQDEELVKLLLELGANPLIRDTMMGLTPLAVAETQRSAELVTLITEASPRGTEMTSPKRTRFSESDV